MPEDYPTAFKEAMAVFRHARVYDIPQHNFIISSLTAYITINILGRYDAASKKLKPLNPLPPELLQGRNGDLDFLGPYPFLFP